jgi:hypothetical protein
MRERDIEREEVVDLSLHDLMAIILILNSELRFVCPEEG